MRLITIILLITFSSQALSADWEILLDDPELKAEIDAERIKPVNKYVFEATFRFTHPAYLKNADNGGLYNTAHVTSRFDCLHKTYAPYHRVEFSSEIGEGSPIGVVNIPLEKLKFSSLMSGSMNEIMYQRVCGNAG